jgi:hypothetical protein
MEARMETKRSLILLGNATWREMAKEWCTICTTGYKMWIENKILLPDPGFDYPSIMSSDAKVLIVRTPWTTLDPIHRPRLSGFSKRTVKELFTARSVTALVLRNQPLTEEVICEAHRVLLQCTEHQKAAGVYRTTNVGAIGNAELSIESDDKWAKRKESWNLYLVQKIKESHRCCCC